jgi:hypothetical protein
MMNNPRPDLHGAPAYLPDVGEMALEPEKWFREIKWMALMFPQLLDEIDQNERLHELDVLHQYDQGFEDGYSYCAENE